jgi:hypothetical protein
MYGYTYGYPSGGGAGAVNGFESAVLSDGGTVVGIGNTTDLYSRLLGLGLINSASLVNSCNGGKADALYNFVPSPVQALDRFTVTRASTKLRIGSNGLYGSVANNVPAFEFNTDGSYRGLLVEPGATNLALYSQEFDNAEWTKTRTTVTANATASPDGATTADLIIPSVDNNTHFVNPSSFSFTSGTVYTWSGFVKASGYNFVNLAFDLGAFAPTGRRASFNLSNGTVAAVQSGVTASISAVGNGFYRCSITATANATASVARGYFFVQSAGNAIPESYTGDGTSGIFLWQAQLETGSVATSPIVTTAGTASRVADVVSLTGASSLIGQSAGTLYAEVESPSYTSPLRRVLSLSDGTANNRININIQSGTNRLYQLFVSNAGVTDANILQVSGATNISKISAGYALNDFVLYINGSQIGTDALSNVPATSRIDIGNLLGSEQFLGWIRSVALFPTRLANATLASLTA